MTIKEAENQYNLEVTKGIEQHKTRLQKSIYIWMIISSIFILLGIVLASIGFNTPPEIGYFGEYYDSTAATFEKIYGIASLCLGVFFLLVIIPMLRNAQKKGPNNFIPQKRNLYLSYLKCEDMSANDKEFYKQKLEDIRNMELVRAINRASAASSAAIMFSALK